VVDRPADPPSIRTMMNKALEIGEAVALFRPAAGEDRVVLTRSPIVHSMVEFRDDRPGRR